MYYIIYILELKIIHFKGELIESTETVSNGYWYRELLIILFLVFAIFFGNIVLMNVFTGLAVEDVQERV